MVKGTMVDVYALKRLDVEITLLGKRIPWAFLGSEKEPVASR
jgi:hypothetical protein